MQPSPAKFVLFRIVAALFGLSVFGARLFRKLLERILLRDTDPYCQVSRFFDRRELE